MNERTISDQGQLVQALRDIMSLENNVRVESEAALSRFCTDSRCLNAFLITITSESDRSVRQIAGTLMRVKIKKFWDELEILKKQHIRNGLMNCLQKETELIVAKSICNCIGEIAVIDIPKNDWNNLNVFLQGLASSTQNDLYISSTLQIFSILLRRIPYEMRSSLSSITNLFAQCLLHRNRQIRGEAIKGLDSFIMSCSTFARFEEVFRIIPPLVDNLKQTIAQKLFFECGEVFGVFETIAGDINIIRNTEVFYSIISMMCDCGLNTLLPPNIRMKALDVLCFAIKTGGGVLVKSRGLMEKIVRTIVSCMCFPESEEDAFDDLSQTLFKSGCSLLDQFAVSIPSVYIFNIIVNQAMKLFRERSNDIYAQKCALSIIGIISEGCSSLTKENLGKFVPMVIHMWRSNDLSVKRIVLMDLCNFSEYCQPDILDFSSHILPVIEEGLNMRDLKIVSKACLLIDIFCDNLQPNELAKVAEPFLKILLALSSTTDPTSEVRRSLLSAIGTIAMNLGDLYSPFFQKTINMLQKTIDLTTNRETELAALRGQAIECVGLVAATCPKMFLPQARRFFDLTINSVRQVRNHDLTEMSLNFISNIAKCLGREFSPYLETSVNFVFSVLDGPDGNIVPRDNHGGQFLEEPPINRNGTDGIGQINLEELDTSNFRLEINSGILDEKAAGVHALSKIAEAVGGVEFQRYFQRSFDFMIQRFSFFSETVQRRVVSCVPVLIRVMFPIIPPQQNQREIFNGCINQFMNNACDRLVEEPDKETISHLCDGISSLIQTYGFRFIENYMNILSPCIIDLINKESECFQSDPEEFDSLQEGDHEDIVFDSLLNLIDEVAKASGPHFRPLLESIFPKLMFYLNRNNVEDQISTIGTLSEITVGMKGMNNMEKYARTFFPVVLKKLIASGDSNQILMRNGLFCIGVVSEYTPQVIRLQDSQLCQKMIRRVLMVPADFRESVVDNACSAMARMCMLGGKQKKKLFPEELLEENLLLVIENLPLKDDFVEYKPVFQWMCELLRLGHPLGVKHFEKLVTILDEMGVNNDDVEEDVREEVRNSLIFLSKKYPQKMNFL